MGIIDSTKFTELSQKLKISEDASFLLSKFTAEIAQLGNNVAQLQRGEQEALEAAIADLQLLVNIVQSHATGAGSDHSSVSLLESKMANVTDDIDRGQHTTVGGGVSEDIAILGLTSSHICTASMAEEGASPVTLKTSICGTDKITLTFSADPSSDHKVNYSIIK